MSWWTNFMNKFFSDEVRGVDDSSKKKTENRALEFVTEFSYKEAFKLEQRKRISTGEVVSSVYEIKVDKFDKFPLTDISKIFDMRLRNQQHQILEDLTHTSIVKSMGEYGYYILLNHMKENNYAKIYPEFYNNVFNSGGNQYAIAYCLMMKSVIEEQMKNCASVVEVNNVSRGVVKINMNTNKALVAVYRDFLRLLNILEQVYPAFSQDLIQLNIFEDFFKSFSSKMTKIVNALPEGVDVVRNTHNDVVSLCQSFIIKVIETETKIQKSLFNVSLENFHNSIFMKPLVMNGIQDIPFNDFSEEINRLLIDVKTNLTYISIEYIKNDLSNEVPKMFDNVLNDVVKNFLSMPQAFRTTMYNNDGKTVEMMLIDVLNIINKRLLVIAQESHKHALREVSVLEKFSQERWQAIS